MLTSRLKSSLIDPTSSTGLIWRLLSEYAATRWHRYAIAFALMAFAAGATALTAYLAGDVINKAYVSRDFHAVIQTSLILMLVFTLRGAATYGHSVILARIGTSIVAENQRRLFDRLQQQNLTYFSERHSTELIARLTSGAAAVNQTLSLVITAIGRDLLTLMALTAVMFVQDPIMSLVVFVIVPPVLFVLRKLVKRIKLVAMTQWHGGAQTLETLQETIQGIRLVKSFTLEDKMRERFHANVASVQGASNKMARVSNRSAPLIETLAGLAIACLMVYAGHRVINTGASPGEFFSFITAFLLAYEPAKRLARLNLDLNVALVNVRVLLDVIDSPPTEPSDEDRPPLKVTTARLEFRDVSFSYRPGEPTIRNMSFVAEPGRMTALVGPSGGGKSTVLNLILRFYEVGGGVIAIDNQDIASVSRRSLRSQVSYVSQDVFLFRTTIRENIAFGRPGATDAEIVAAARAAQAHDFISGFPKGYDTMVGERGLGLSGGERQRIAIARALVKNAPLILLDEATASLDSESEHYVQKAVAELCKGRTTLVIAHRLSTIMHADNILVIEAGEVTDSGRHDELLRKAGRYALFYRLQLQHQQEREPITASGG
ncbi:MAG: ABC transporter ATP-binding protein/permease [Xanthobacteraceae bacterium]|nr:ABC transporter ATP-binding protein/permease [Xanthobacteraceae bacterium]